MKRTTVAFLLLIAVRLNLYSQIIYKSAHLLIGKNKEQIIEAKGRNYELTNEGDITYDINNPTGITPQIIRYSFSEVKCDLIAFFYKKEQLDEVKKTMNKLFSLEEVKLPGSELYVKLWVETEGKTRYTWSLTDNGSLFYLTVMHYKGIGSGGDNQDKQPSVSKEQTEDWIQEKLNKYVAKSTITCVNPFDNGSSHNGPPALTKCDTYSNVIFRFNGDFLIITCHVNETMGGQNEKNFDRTIKIPLYSLSEFSCWSTGISFHSDFNAMEELNSNGDNLKCNYAGFGFSGDDEDNLSGRLQTAFSHLKSFFKKPNSNEVF